MNKLILVLEFLEFFEDRITFFSVTKGNHRAIKNGGKRKFHILNACLDKPGETENTKFPLLVKIVYENDLPVGINFRWDVFKEASANEISKTYFLTGDITFEKFHKLVNQFLEKRDFETEYEGIFIRKVKDLDAVYKFIDPNFNERDM